ncbi:hypothetical protein FUAX_37710 [Fulvitalea axinellae]|uniref:Uncharacterized protein n=1 Tax=Fulvitalea axinellae TaxID=1182444 RepID=A0AAU9CGM5_9BACT|nr:hypothetical protein FUAX_37710 [Fulvitalea axinellae]
MFVPVLQKKDFSEYRVLFKKKRGNVLVSVNNWF